MNSSFNFFKFSLQNLFLFCTFLICSSVSAYTVKKISPVFDDRKWELGWSQYGSSDNKMDNPVFDEYVLKGENVDNWSELVTIQFFPGLNRKVSIENYANDFKESINKICPNTVWSSDKSKKDEIILYFSIKNCSSQNNQSEILRIVNTDDDICVFHYAIKIAPMPESNKKTWTKNLQAIKVK